MEVKLVRGRSFGVGRRVFAGSGVAKQQALALGLLGAQAEFLN